MLKLDVTQHYSDLSNIREEIDGSGAYTMFAPTDDAWKQLDVVRQILFTHLFSVIAYSQQTFNLTIQLTVF